MSHARQLHRHRLPGLAALASPGGRAARSTGKVVFFARHVDVMDAAEEAFVRQGVRFSSLMHLTNVGNNFLLDNKICR
jgi:hypothetical protein